jgi:DNA-directed RNA polymerase specialized sigma24 family protein
MDRTIIRDYRDLAPDYAWDPSIFNAEPERVARVKEIIDTRLSQVDRTIFLMYTDCQSFRKLGKRFGLSHSTVRKEVERIKDIIRGYYYGTR